MKQICKLEVRTYECDHYGHVNNAVYLNYLEYARCQFLQSVGFDYNTVVKAGYGLYVARVEIDYVLSAWPGEELTIYTWPIKKGAVSGILEQEIWHGNSLLVKAKVTWAFVNKEGRPVKIPPEFNCPGLAPEKEASQ